MEVEKKEKVLGIRLTQNQFEKVQKAVKEKHITASTLARVLIEMYLRKEVHI